MVIDPAKTYTATIETSAGTMTAEFFTADAPSTVNNFVFLARDGYYADVIFHRCIKGFMIQGGDPTGTGRGGPGYRFNDEPVKRQYLRGTLAMANAGEGSNGSQFFITFAPAEKLNDKYTIFGQVISWMEVLLSLTPREPEKKADLPPGDLIVTILIEEK